MSGMLSDMVGEHEGGHSGGAVGVGVGEGAAVILDEGRVTGHAEVGLHIRGGMAVGI
jgi:hypothetical protein